MDVKFTNNGHSTLAASLSTSATSITVASGHGARFPSLSGSAYFFATLIDASNNLEIVKCTARSSDLLCVTRAQESTSAIAFAIGDRIELRVTAGGLGAIYSEAVADATPAADSIVNSMIATDAVNADSIVADAVGASELNVSGNGSAGQVLASDGDGTMSWAAAASGKLVGMEKIYWSDTNVVFSSQSGTQLSGNTYYPNSGRISGTYNKQKSDSHILMLIKYSMGHSSTNVHGDCAWRTGKESAYRNIGNDARTFGWYHDEGQNGSFVTTTSVWWNGASSSEVQGTGNMTFNYAPAVNGTRTHSHELNFNPHSNTYGNSNSDTPSRNTHSEIIIMEYEA